MLASGNACADYWDWVGKGTGQTSYFDDANGNKEGINDTCWYKSGKSNTNFKDSNHNISTARRSFTDGWDGIITFRAFTTLSGALNDDNSKTVIFASENGSTENGINSSKEFNLEKDAQVRIDSGTYKFSYLKIGSASGKTAHLTINGGTVKVTGNYTRIGDGGGDGVLTVKADGIYDNTGCSNNPNMTLGQASGSSGTLNIEGGRFTVTGYIALNYANGSKKSTMKISDGGVLTTGKIYLNHPSTDGGTITLDGGTIKASGSYDDLILSHDNLHVYVGESGAVFDTNGKTVKVAEPLMALVNADGSKTSGGLSVIGGGAVKFFEAGDLTGPFSIGENTELSYFDQDGIVDEYTISSLNIASGATIALNVDSKGCDVLNAAEKNITATKDNCAKFKLVVHEMPESGRFFPIMAMDAADVNKFTVVAESSAGAKLDVELGYTDGFLTYAIIAKDYVWNKTKANWCDLGAWDVDGVASNWQNNNNAVFANAGDFVKLEDNSDVVAVKLDFRANAEVGVADGATAAISTPVVSVDADVVADLRAPVSSAFIKEGAGTLVLGASRGDLKTTLSAGTLRMAKGSIITPIENRNRLQLGTSAEPVVFDYGGQILEWHPGYYLAGEGAGKADVTLTNGVFKYATNATLSEGNTPKSLTIATDAEFCTSGEYLWLADNKDAESFIKIIGGKISAAALKFMEQGSGIMIVEATEGGILESLNTGYFLSCTSREGLIAPTLKMKFTGGSVFRSNNADLKLGQSSNNKNPQAPEFVLEMKDSFLDSGTGAILLGNNVVGSNHGGSYKASFDNCIITAKQFAVYHDRPQNAAHFNGTTFVLSANNDWSFESHTGFGTQGGEWENSVPITIGSAGLVIDTQGYNGQVKANPQGEGAIVKKGRGKLTIAYSQTATAPLVCEAGEMFFSSGVSISRPVTVKSDAIFTTKATAKSMFANVTFEADSVLNLDTYTAGITPIKFTALTLPESGSMKLTFNGGNFTTGTYAILEKEGISAEDFTGKLVPQGAASYSYSVVGNTLVLTVGEPVHGRWRASALSGSKMSIAGNWEDGNIPNQGDVIDFSTVSSAITIDADIDAVFGDVMMGSGVITFTGSLTATSFSDTSKIAVGNDSIVTYNGDLIFTGSGMQFITDKVGSGGIFKVTGMIKCSGPSDLRPYRSASEGWIFAAKLENANNGDWAFRLNNDNPGNWIIGAGGITGKSCFWSMNNNNASTTIKAGADFLITTWLSTGSSAGKGISLDTAGWKITADEKGFTGIKPLLITGGGTFLCNYVPQRVDANGPVYSGTVTVDGNTTLAINAEKKVSTGAITIKSGASLEVAQSGTVEPAGSLTFEDGATLKFNFTKRNEAPILKLSDKSVNFGESKTIKVSLSGIRPASNFGESWVLTEGGKFAWEDSEDGLLVKVGISEVVNAPKWLKSVAVNDEGNICAEVYPLGSTIILR